MGATTIAKLVLWVLSIGFLCGKATVEGDKEQFKESVNELRNKIADKIAVADKKSEN